MSISWLCSCIGSNSQKKTEKGSVRGFVFGVAGFTDQRDRSVVSKLNAGCSKCRILLYFTRTWFYNNWEYERLFSIEKPTDFSSIYSFDSIKSKYCLIAFKNQKCVLPSMHSTLSRGSNFGMLNFRNYSNYAHMTLKGKIYDIFIWKIER